MHKTPFSITHTSADYAFLEEPKDAKAVAERFAQRVEEDREDLALAQRVTEARENFSEAKLVSGDPSTGMNAILCRMSDNGGS